MKEAILVCAKKGAAKWKEDITVLVGILAVCVFYAKSGVGCPMKWLTGISCAGCGMTRAVLCAVRLQFAQAFYYHPLFFLVPICVLALFFGEAISPKVKKYMVWSVVFCFFAVYILRLLNPDCTVVACELENGVIFRVWKYFKN